MLRPDQVIESKWFDRTRDRNNFKMKGSPKKFQHKETCLKKKLPLLVAEWTRNIKPKVGFTLQVDHICKLGQLKAGKRGETTKDAAERPTSPYRKKDETTRKNKERLKKVLS